MSLSAKQLTIVRESLASLVRLITGRGVRVTQEGSIPFVEYNPSGEINRMNIPNIPDGASEDFVAAIQGFVDHECGHVLDSDPAMMTKHFKRVVALPHSDERKSKMLNHIKMVGNLIEDVRIEDYMERKFPGAKKNLAYARGFMIKKSMEMAVKHPEHVQGCCLPIMYRAYGEQPQMVNCVADNKAMFEVGTTPYIDSLGGDALLRRIPHCKSTDDAYALAFEIVTAQDAFEEGVRVRKAERAAAEERARVAKEKDRKDAATKKSKASAKKEVTDDLGSEPEGSHEPDSGEDAASGEPTGDAAAEAEESVETDDESVDPSGRSDSDSGEPDAGVGTSDPSEEGEESPVDEIHEGLDGTGDDPEDHSGPDAGDADPEDEHPVSGAPGYDPAFDGDPDPGDREDPMADSEGGLSPEEEEAALRATDAEIEDFEEAMGKMISGEIKDLTVKRDTYNVVTRDLDEIGRTDVIDAVVEANRKRINEAAEAIADRVRPMIGAMQKSLERSLASKNLATWNPGQRRGRINPGSLFKVAVGDDRVFRTRYTTKAKNTVVQLVIDLSASMDRNKMRAAADTAYAIAYTLERLKIRCEIIGFTTLDHGSAEDRKAHEIHMELKERGDEVEFHRSMPLLMPLVKRFDERLTGVAMPRVAALASESFRRILCENMDGECVQIAAGRLATQREERKVMFVLSDGEPCGPMLSGGRAKLYDHLKMVVKDIEKSGIEVVGVGIQTAAVSRFYTNHFSISNVSELPSKVTKELVRILAKD